MIRSLCKTTCSRPTRLATRNIAFASKRSLTCYCSIPAVQALALRSTHIPPTHSHTKWSFRPLSTSRTNHAPQQTSFADPDRPELFYHLYHPPTSISRSSAVFAVSFLENAPAEVDSCAVIGWLPAESEAATGESEEAGLNDFKPNAKFVDVLHEAVASGIRDGVDDIQINGAVQTQQGWMHIHDNRNIPALGRIGDPDDIIASVRVEDGKILPETYQPMPSYRLCTSDGILQLTEGLFGRLKEVLAQKVIEEAKSGKRA